MKLLQLALILITGISITQTQAQKSKPAMQPEPGWITRNVIAYSDSYMDSEAEDGYADVNFEKQVLLEKQWKYIRKTMRIISETGVQNCSQVSVSYDPSFEKLVFHTIRIIRDGKELNRLNMGKMKVIQQEEELDNFIYNGSLNAVFIMDDVRKGDVVDYSYSLIGFNSIFNGKYADFYPTNFSFPLYNLYYKLVMPGDRKINISNSNDTIKAIKTSTSGNTVYEWRKTKLSPLHVEDGTPSWYDPYGYIMLSEYDSWQQVKEWAGKLFPLNVALAAELQKKVGEIKAAANTPEAQLLSALRFVQDDVRYMGFEMGENSHKPSDPSKVFKQRFGDCKEKSYLLCTMLHAMGIESTPVLINTSTKKGLKNELPSPVSFDHVTVRVKLNNNYYWFDPTISYQRGPLDKISYPDYQYGLAVFDEGISLAEIPHKTVGDTRVKEVFDVPGMTGNAKLTVTTTYSGSFADDARSDFNAYSLHEMQNTYKRFYATYFDDIASDSLVYKDDEANGTFTTKEYYSIDGFWEKKNGVSKASFECFVIQGMIRKPKDKKRKMPFRLSYPAKCYEEIEINLFEDWDVTPDDMNITCSSFKLKSKFSASPRKILLQYEYEIFKDFVSPEETPEYLASMEKSEEEQGFYISRGGNSSEIADVSAPSKNTPVANTGANVLLSVLLFSGVAGGVWWWHRRYNQWR